MSLQYVPGKGQHEPVMQVCFAGVTAVVVAENDRCSPAYHPGARFKRMIGATSRIGNQYRERIRYDGRRFVRGIRRKVGENFVRFAEPIGIGRPGRRVAPCPCTDKKNAETCKDTVVRHLSNPMLH